MFSCVADILLCSVKWRSDVFRLAFAERAAAFDATLAGFDLVCTANLNHCFGELGRESGSMSG